MFSIVFQVIRELFIGGAVSEGPVTYQRAFTDFAFKIVTNIVFSRKWVDSFTVRTT